MKINVGQKIRVEVSNLIPRFEKLCGVQLAKHPIDKSGHRLLPQAWGPIRELAMPSVSITL